MFHRQEVKVIAVQLLALISLWPENCDCLIITSVLAGDKKFKTISFDTKFLKPLMFEKEMPNTEFRRHRTMRPPKFDIDVNIPIKLPLEDEYYKEEPKKPVESHLFFQTDEIVEPGYKKPSYNNDDKNKYYPNRGNVVYKDEMAYAASNNKNNNNNNNNNFSNRKQVDVLAPRQSDDNEQQLQLEQTSEPNLQTISSVGKKPRQQLEYTPNYNPMHQNTATQQQNQQQETLAQESSEVDFNGKGYGAKSDGYSQEFVPGGFVNLQLSGPTGGPKPTYADYDRERWAQQLSQTAGAMPYPILNYQQLQNFYGGLGTFTNGLAENRYMPTSLLDKLKSGISHFTNKFHHFSFSH